MTTKKFSECWICNVKVEEGGLVHVKGPRMTAQYCYNCFKDSPPHPEAFVYCQTFEFVGPKPPGPKNIIYPEPLKDENKACMENPNYQSHANRLDDLNERISNLGAHQNSTALRQNTLHQDLDSHEHSQRVLHETIGHRIEKLENKLAKKDLPDWASLAKRLTELEMWRGKFSEKSWIQVNNRLSVIENALAGLGPKIDGDNF